MTTGGQERAFDWFEEGLEVRDPNMPYLGVTPFRTVRHDDQRFQSLLRRMNLLQ
jgi:hypothetical protein